MDNYTLKRGEGLSCESNKDWRDPKTSWYFWPVYVPNGMEKFCGVKTFHGRPYGVFQCMDDSYYAQEIDVLLLPVPHDPMRIVSILTKEARAMTDQSGSNLEVQGLVFKGTNWKLAGDKKWKPAGVSVVGLKKVGSRVVRDQTVDVYDGSGCFFAVKQA